MRFQDMTDPQVLEHVGVMGRLLVGDYLYERAEWIRANNPMGHTGPEVVGYFQPSDAAKQDLRERGMLDEVVEEVVEEKRKVGRPKKVVD